MLSVCVCVCGCGWPALLLPVVRSLQTTCLNPVPVLWCYFLVPSAEPETCCSVLSPDLFTRCSLVAFFLGGLEVSIVVPVWQCYHHFSTGVETSSIFRPRLQVLHTGPIATHVVATVCLWLVCWSHGWFVAKWWEIPYTVFDSTEVI